MRGLAPLCLIMAIMIVTALGLRHTRHELPASSASPALPDTENSAPCNPSSVSGKNSDFVAIARDHSGFYQVQALMDGHFVDMLIDTGARLVALTREDANRLDFDTENLPRNVLVLTASGQTSGTRVWIDEIAIGEVVVRDVEAVILDDSLNRSLLGMSFLSQVSRLELTPDQIIIYQ